MWSSDPVIEYSSFYGNEAGYGGAVKCVTNSNPVIRYSLFCDNYAIENGGAIEVDEGSYPLLVNNTIANNDAGGWGGGISLAGCDNDSVIFINNILWGNQCAMGERGQQVGLISVNNIASFKYNDIEGGTDNFGPGNFHKIYYAPNNFSGDPLFCEPEDLVYTIGFGSPCVGTGQGGVNIGAFNPDCFADVPGNLAMAKGFAIYPNPYYAGSPLMVSFSQESPGQVKLEIFSLTGEKVYEPLTGSYTAGEHQEILSVDWLPAGIYVARLTLNGETRVTRLVSVR
jgi:predicted outer membrane repeat protein